MKYVIVFYSIINGQNIEQGRMTDNPATFEQCQNYARVVEAYMFEKEPDFIGQVKVGCAPE